MKTISAQEFLNIPELGCWGVEKGRAVARFASGTFARGVEFVVAIGQIADNANHHPDIELTYPQVVVRLITHDAGGVLTTLDAQVAREITEAGQKLKITCKN